MTEFVLAVGRIVHYRTAGGERPAIITHVFEHREGMANLVVFSDGTYDYKEPAPVRWQTSVLRGGPSEEGHWHVPQDCIEGVN